ncbi:MAG: ribonuclease HII [Verrucomicrobiaceae bacterium]|nr:ribonuclease HII [Verrucomicrobiaceae bacterium]
MASGHGIVCGVDEVGRGPLAGPVCAAAVILPLGFEHQMLNDSKKLTEKQREKIYEELTGMHGVVWALSLVDAQEIDRLNILQASREAMRRAVSSLSLIPNMALIDGLPVPDFPVPQRAIVKGDSISLSIAAASVIAKVTRDRLMLEWAERFPHYGFDVHKGYPTPRHLEALAKHGPCEIHRRSFGPVAQQTFRFEL